MGKDNTVSVKLAANYCLDCRFTKMKMEVWYVNSSALLAAGTGFRERMNLLPKTYAREQMDSLTLNS
jgi:hypothetical protein